MSIQKKEEVVAALAEKLGGANTFYLTDFTGLNVKRMTEFRARLRAEGLEYLVVKNTLAERALAGTGLPDLAEHFRGPTGVVIGNDPVSPAKVISDFAKDNDNRPAVKAGIVERRAVSAAEVERLAKLPPRDQLLAELAGAFEAPIAQLYFALQAKLNEFAGLLEALRNERDA